MYSIAYIASQQCLEIRIARNKVDLHCKLTEEYSGLLRESKLLCSVTYRRQRTSYRLRSLAMQFPTKPTLCPVLFTSVSFECFTISLRYPQH